MFCSFSMKLWAVTRGGSARPSKSVKTQNWIDGMDNAVECRHVLVDDISSVHLGHTWMKVVVVYFSSEIYFFFFLFF